MPKLSLAQVFSQFLERRSGLLILVALGLTAILILPMTLMAPTELASNEPGGEVFDLRDEVDLKLASSVYPSAYVVEARDGNMLTQAGLFELLANQRTLLTKDAKGELAPSSVEPRPLLAESYSPDSGVSFTGITSVANAVDDVLRLHPLLETNLEQATDEQVQFAVHLLLENPVTVGVADQFSVHATSVPGNFLGIDIAIWSSPALTVLVLADNDALGGGSRSIGLATDDATLNRERFARSVQETLRGEQEHVQVWGIAIDINLSSQEQGSSAGLYITLTVIAALTVVGLTLRSYWATALTAVGIGWLMIWLKGFSALLGIKGGLVVDLIVPIAMVSLGVDFAVHAARRYQEERRAGLVPNRALTIGMSGVLGALLLAMLSDGIAFLSNTPSGIESVVQFGIAAGIAVISSFTVLGVVMPVALMRLDQLSGSVKSARPLLRAGAAMGATSFVGSGVIILVAVSLEIGAVILAIATALFAGLPWLILSARWRTENASTSERVSQEPIIVPPSTMEALTAGVVVSLARRRIVLIPLVGLLTLISVLAATRLEAAFDVKDFYAADSDIVVSLDKLDRHIGDRSGEGGTLFVEGDLSQPEALRELQGLLNRLAENPYLGKEFDGSPSVFERHVLTFVQRVMENPYAKDEVERVTGTPLTDADADLIPDDDRQLQALYAYAREYGIPIDEANVVYSPDVVRTALYFDPVDPAEAIAIFIVGIPGTREQSVIAPAGSALLADLAPLKERGSFKRVGITGSPFVRDAELTATVRNLRTSLPIAVAGTLVLLLVALRSVRYALITVVPIGLVVAWLYALMHLFGFALNFVSATIGAVSVGVGIDYSIHMTERFREEMARTQDRIGALYLASRGTGVALLGSAGSSIVGFAIMGFAPMPMFSTYGILTALMIFLALVAALLVLPSLLMAVTPQPKATAASVGRS